MCLQQPSIVKNNGKWTVIGFFITSHSSYSKNTKKSKNIQVAPINLTEIQSTSAFKLEYKIKIQNITDPAEIWQISGFQAGLNFKPGGNTVWFLIF